MSDENGTEPCSEETYWMVVGQTEHGEWIATSGTLHFVKANADTARDDWESLHITDHDNLSVARVLIPKAQP